MTTDRGLITGHPAGEQPLVECGKPGSVVADTFAGRVHMEWEAGERAAVTPLGQLRIAPGKLKISQTELPSRE